MNFNEIAFYFGDTQVMWHGILIGIAILGAVITALIFRLVQGENVCGVLIAAGLSCLICPILSRLVYWYCCSGQFSSFYSAVTDYSGGGFSIMGVIAGIFLSAYITWLIKADDSFGKLLDCILPAGVLGTAVARLGGFFTPADKGKFIVQDKNFQKLPFAFPVENSAGEFEWRIPTFLYEAIASFIVFLILLVIFFAVYSKEKQSKTGVPALLSMCFFGAVQTCLESMRYDTLYMRSNGFVSLVQIFFIIITLIPFFIFLVKSIKTRGFKVWHALLIAAVLALTGAAAYCEYLVQRYADKFIGLYCGMLACLVLICVITGVAAIFSGKKEQTENLN